MSNIENASYEMSGGIAVFVASTTSDPIWAGDLLKAYQALSALGDPVVVAEALPELVEAAEDMTLIWRQDGEGYSEHADRVAEIFRKETGLMAPGKDAGLVGAPAQQAMRQQRYDEWWEARGKRFLNALAKLKARP